MRLPKGPSAFIPVTLTVSESKSAAVSSVYLGDLLQSPFILESAYEMEKTNSFQVLASPVANVILLPGFVFQEMES